MGVYKKLIATALVFITLLVGVVSCSSSANIVLGKKAPSFTAISIDNMLINLNDFLGKTVILNFWDIRYSYCVGGMPYNQQIYDEYADDGLVVLGINDAKSIGNVKPFIGNHKYSYTIILDEYSSIGNKYGIYYFPTTFFIDKSGIICDVIIGSFQNE